MPHLTICVPTRNRQRYLMETIRALAESDRRDFEVIVADNSDDAGILADHFAHDFGDDRFRLLAPEAQVLSMVDNWERAAAAATGRWVVFIGDDDYLDPRLSDLIQRYERLHPQVETVNWTRMHFNWPDNRTVSTLATIPVTFSTVIANKADLQNRLYRWSQGRRRPAAGFGIYHGAVKRGLMERIKRKYGGRYFEHPNVDYESSCKVIAEAKTLIHCQRPFSVLGACAASNSAGTRSREVMAERTRTFLAEAKNGTIPTEHPDFPFPLSDNCLSICVGIAHVTYWFCRAYDIDLTGFPENFAKSADDECRHASDLDEYERKIEGFERGFRHWEGGKWAKHFKPAPFTRGIRALNGASGLTGDIIYLRESRIAPETPVAFYRYGEHAVMPVEHVVSGTRTFAR